MKKFVSIKDTTYFSLFYNCITDVPVVKLSTDSTMLEVIHHGFNQPLVTKLSFIGDICLLAWDARFIF